jgi:hypothetical protein
LLKSGHRQPENAPEIQFSTQTKVNLCKKESERKQRSVRLRIRLNQRNALAGFTCGPTLPDDLTIIAIKAPPAIPANKWIDAVGVAAGHHSHALQSLGSTAGANASSRWPDELNLASHSPTQTAACRYPPECSFKDQIQTKAGCA